MSQRMRIEISLIVLVLLTGATASATNYDEDKVGTYTLPDPLTLANGQPVRDADTWMNQRRPEIVKLFEENQFGRCPDAPANMTSDLWDEDRHAMDGKAIRKQITVYFNGLKDGPQMDIGMYLPADAGEHPVPLFLCLSFTGNHQVLNDPKLKMNEQWNKTTKAKEMPKEETRGKSAKSWPIEKVLARGYGMAFVCYNDIEPDFDGGMKYGVRPLFFKPGQTEPGRDEWGS